jgi:hypothetical protein
MTKKGKSRNHAQHMTKTQIKSSKLEVMYYALRDNVER